MRRSQIDIAEIFHPEKVKKNEPLTIQIEGFVRDGAWEPQNEQVEINEIDKIVRIIWQATRDPNLMGIQVIINLNKTVTVKIPVEGTWKIQCNKKESTIKVE